MIFFQARSTAASSATPSPWADRASPSPVSSRSSWSRSRTRALRVPRVRRRVIPDITLTCTTRRRRRHSDRRRPTPTNTWSTLPIRGEIFEKINYFLLSTFGSMTELVSKLLKMCSFLFQGQHPQLPALNQQRRRRTMINNNHKNNYQEKTTSVILLDWKVSIEAGCQNDFFSQENILDIFCTIEMKRYAHPSGIRNILLLPFCMYECVCVIESRMNNE